MSINITGVIGVNGGVQMSAPGSPPPPQTYYSNLFDGTGDSLSLSSNAAFAFETGNFTVEFWIRPNSISTTSSFFDLRTPDTTNAGFVIGVFERTLFVSTAGTNYITTSETLSNDVWYHIALTRSGTSMKLFLNGTQIGSTYTSNQNFTNNTPRIATGAAGTYSGYISNLRVVKGTAVYTSAFTPPTAPLTAISGTSLLTCQSATFIDNSPNNFTVSAVGDVAVSTQNPFN